MAWLPVLTLLASCIIGAHAGCPFMGSRLAGAVDAQAGSVQRTGGRNLKQRDERGQYQHDAYRGSAGQDRQYRDGAQYDYTRRGDRGRDRGYYDRGQQYDYVPNHDSYHVPNHDRYDVRRDRGHYDGPQSDYVRTRDAGRYQRDTEYGSTGYTGNAATGPGYTGPGSTGPGYTGPGFTGPGYTGPGYTGPGGVDKLDWAALKADLASLLRTSNPAWPADYGYYGGLMIRLAWHCAGSYRAFDGRGGCDGGRIRFDPELSWDDNANLDKARMLLEPIKYKYGDALSWADLIALVGDMAFSEGGAPVLGFCAGRIDDVDGTDSIPLGPNKEQEAIAPCDDNGACMYKLGATTLGLIYVNPEGPKGNPVPEESAPQIRSTFSRMGMNDSETVALIGGGHAFGKAHGPCKPEGEKKICGTGEMAGKGPNTFTSGFEGPWVETPTEWSNYYFTNLLKYEWQKEKSPAGHWQWYPSSSKYDGDKPKIMMLTSDIALLTDPEYLKYVELYAKDMSAFEHAFKHAWYKLTTRDMGPVTRCLGKEVPPPQPWQCPLPDPPKYEALPDLKEVAKDIEEYVYEYSNEYIEADKVDGKPYYGALFSTLAFQCASTYRRTDYRGGCNGARIRFSPQKDWPVNAGMDKVLKVLQPVKDKHSTLSYADLIVLAGTLSYESAGAKETSFCGARVDADAGCEEHDLYPREYVKPETEIRDTINLWGLTLREGVALFGRLRSCTYQKMLGYSGSWSDNANQAGPYFFKTLLSHTWEAHKSEKGLDEYKGVDTHYYITPLDYALLGTEDFKKLVEEYSQDEGAFWKEFHSGWTKLMNADRFGGPGVNVCEYK